MKMSASQGALFNSCNRQWQYKYLLKVQPDKKVTYAATLYGSALHSVLEELVPSNESIEDKMHKAPLLFLKEFKKHYSRSKQDGYHVIVSGGDLKKVLREYVYSSKIAVGKILNNELVKNYKQLLCEGEFNHSNKHFELVAKIDLVGTNEDGSYDIVDFKTGKHFSFKGIKDELQALFYIRVCYERFGKLPKSFKFLKFDKDKMSLEVIDIGEEITMDTITHFDNAVEKLNEGIETSIQNNYFEKIDDKMKSQACQWCQYKISCSKSK